MPVAVPLTGDGQINPTVTDVFTQLPTPKADVLFVVAALMWQEARSRTFDDGPIYVIEDVMRTPVLILPIANHDNNQHAENENIRLQNVWDAMAIYGAVLATFGDR